jgi:GNAT superfamily N-acetyltransferase
VDEFEYRALRSQKDATGYVRLHNTTFPPITFDYWRSWASAEDVTISLALKGDEVVGAVPFHIRDFRVRPDANVKTAFEFSVLVREDLRGKGVGSGVMDKAKAFLRESCDVMMVYRGGELSQGYNFYLRNGHYDVAYLRPVILRHPKRFENSGVEITDVGSLFDAEGDVLRTFNSAFGGFGGYPMRCAGYYRRALNTIQYEELKLDLNFAFTEVRGKFAGYAIIGKAIGGEPEIVILEIASLHGEKATALRLLKGISDLASKGNCAVSTHVPDSSIYSSILNRMGFERIPRSSNSLMIMAHLLNPNSLAQKVWRENEKFEHVEVRAWSSANEVILHEAQTPCSRKIVLEMKDDVLTRLLLSRLDIVSAVEQELVTVVGGGLKDVREIAKSLPYTHWEHHHIDYI